MLADLPCRHAISRQGTKFNLSARFVAIHLRIGGGPVWGNNRHLPGAEVWLVDERRSSGERKNSLSSWSPDRPRRALAGTIKARWGCEQAYRQIKEGLGLNHLDEQSWTGIGARL